MISTLLGYQLYGNNLTQSLQRTAAEPAVSQAQSYYNANIGKVKSVSDLVNNFQLLSYATQAFGLSNMTYAKALLTQVLESNLSDTTSVANQLGGSYVAFAQAFSFNTDGSLKTTAQMQTSGQQSATEALFNASTTLDSSDAATATQNYETAMKTVTSVSQLEQSPAALGYVLDAYGISPTSAPATLEPTLESDLSASGNFVGQQADSGYLAASQAVTINADGSAATVTEAETDANISATTTAYMGTVDDTSAAQTAAQTETTYFLSKITSVSSVDDITSDSRLVSYLEKAYDLPSTTTTDEIAQALTSDPSDDTSFAKTSPYPGFATMASAFNFTTAGAAGTVTQFQSDPQQQATIQAYEAHQTSDSAASAAETTYYKANIGAVKSVTDLEADPRLLSYFETAYGIDPTTDTTTLTSVLDTTGGVPSTTAKASLLALKLDFNVDGSGDATNPLTAESSANISATTSAYMASAGTDAASQTAAKAATAYYQTAMAKVTSVSDVLADPKLVAYVEQAYNVPTTTTTDTLRQILTSDVADPKSVAVTMGSNTETLSAAFDFSSTGQVAPETQGAQSKAQLDAINKAYLDNEMENEAGQQNPGIKLALYFDLNASKITSAYDILADKQLSQVFQVMQGLPATAANADVDAQAKSIAAQFNLSDMKNQTYVSSLVERFSILYDLNPPASTSPDTTVSLFSGSSGTLDVTSLFSSDQDDETSSSTTALFGS